jgi:methylated-DNA-[protein]-cysteine S-methyltransferase
VLAVVWRIDACKPPVTRILVPKSGTSVQADLAGQRQAAPREHPEIDRLCERIVQYLEGRDVSLELDLLDLSLCTSFQWTVLTTVYQIPRGEVRTYSQLAEMLSNPSAPRAVANALAHNPFPVVIPCHRAVRSDGSLGGYQGGLRLKRALLEIEGIAFDEQGGVLPKHWGEDQRTGT